MGYILDIPEKNILWDKKTDINGNFWYKTAIQFLGTVTSGSKIITLLSDSVSSTALLQKNLLYKGCQIRGTGIVEPSYITDIDLINNQITIDNNCTANGNNTLYFDNYSDYETNILANAISVYNKSATETAKFATIGQKKAIASQTCLAGQNKWYTINSPTLFKQGDIVCIDVNMGTPETHTIAGIVYNKDNPNDLNSNYLIFAENLANTFNAGKTCTLVSSLVVVPPNTQTDIIQTSSFNFLQCFIATGSQHNVDFKIYTYYNNFNSNLFEIAYKSDFKDTGKLTDDLLPWYPQCVDGGIVISNDPIVTNTNKVVKFTGNVAWDYSLVDGGYKPRGEIYGIKEDRLKLYPNQKNVVKWKSFIPSVGFDIETNLNNTMSIMQLHQDILSGSPTFSIEIDRDSLQHRVWIDNDYNRVIFLKSSERNTIENLFDRWVEWELYIDKKDDNTGLIILIRDGEVVAYIQSINQYTQPLPALNFDYIKFGWYKYAWQTSSSSVTNIALFIKDIEIYKEVQQNVITVNSSIMAQALANYLPSGKQWVAKNIQESNLRKLLEALGIEFARMEDLIQWLKKELNPLTTEDLINLWEQALGIPDDIFDIENISLQQRRLQIQVKHLMNGADRPQQWEYIASLFGYEIKVNPARKLVRIGDTFPDLLSLSTAEQMKCTVVDFYGVPAPSVFTLTFDFIFTDNISIIINKIINKLKPANTLILYRYK